MTCGRWCIAARFRVGLCLALAMLGKAGLAGEIPPLIPWPQQISQEAATLELPSGTPVRFSGGDPRVVAIARYLLTQLDLPRDATWRLDPDGHAPAAGPAVRLELSPQAPVAQAEGYQLTVSGDGVRILARDEAGLLHGAVTLSQLAQAGTRNRVVRLQQGQIQDWPAFRWRGLMVDSVRHFQSPEELRRLIDEMTQLKLNVLHWHLSDDQGWRIEIRRYPELTRIGAWRTPPHAGLDGEPRRYGGYYSQDQVRALVAYAAARQITIMPELDLPGHAQAAVASYPEVGVTGRRPDVGVDWGVNPYLYSPGPGSIQFIEHVLDEVMALFPSRYIDLGGDEAIKDQWRASPVVQQQMHRLGLPSEDALQGWMMGQLADYLSRHGRHLVGWDEILQGGQVPADATVMSWRGSQGAIQAARAGHDVVLSPSPDLYLDQLQTDTDDETSGRAPVRSLAQVYAFQVVPSGLNSAQARHVLGAQANVWTEHLPSREHLEHAVFPRLDALAEVVWSGPSHRDWAGFLQRLPLQLARYRREGLAYADNAFEPVLKEDRDQAVATGELRVSISNQVGSGIFRYTLDGSDPGPRAVLYQGPLNLRLPVTLKVASLDAEGRPLAAIRRFALTRENLLSLDSSELEACSGPDSYLRLLPQSDATGLQPVYNVNVFDGCWRYPATRLDRVRSVRVEVGRLPRNYGLAGDADKVVRHPPGSRYGQLQVFLDDCTGSPLLRLDLPDPARSPFRYSLQGRLPVLAGRHRLCLRSTAPIEGPLYGLQRVSLQLAPPSS
ncbi:family 20 glycosylhydrolase [Frateuria aurantia]